MEYTTSEVPSSEASETLRLYNWSVPNPSAAVFLLHGFRSHTRFNFLRNDSVTSLHNYGGDDGATSFIRELNLKNCTVFAHDHVGHGDSTGLRAYFPRFETLVSDAISHINFINAKHKLVEQQIPIFLIGHSMGGTVAIQVSRQISHMITGMALSSAATEPPSDMFGLMGRIQKALSGLTSALIPTAQLLKLPNSTDENLHRLYEADRLNYQGGLRARVGREFLNAYDDIHVNVSDITVPILIIGGELDTLVNPEAAKRFYQGIGSKDKTLKTAKGRWHNLLVENGKEEVWGWIVEWIGERMKR